jgi:hypothetical protein
MVICDPKLVDSVTGQPATDQVTGYGTQQIVTSACMSAPGSDGVFGTGDDGTIYYREATENGLRAFTRENRAHAFSFINGIGINHPDLCGEVTDVDGVTVQGVKYLGQTLVKNPGNDGIFGTKDDPADDPATSDIDESLELVDAQSNECGDSPSTGTRQVMFQNIQELGATLSCFNCSALGQHTVPDHGFDKYSFKWTPLPGVHIPEDHPVTGGTIPE